MKVRNLLSTAVLVTLFMSLTACDSGSDKVELVPVKTSKTGNWSMLAPDGTIKYDAEFKGEPTECINGIFTVKNEDGSFSLYSADGTSPKEVDGCDSLYQAGIMNEGVIPVTKKGSHIELIDKKGESRAKLDKCDGQQIIKCHANISCGLLGVTVTGNKCGYVDKTGKTMIQPKYDIINMFVDNYALVGTKDDSGNTKYQIIDTEGKTVMPIKEKYKPISLMLKGHIILKDSESERFCVMDKNGNITKFPDKAEMYRYFDGKYFIFGSEGQYGAMNMEGEIVIRPKYHKLSFCDEDTFWGQKHRDSGLVKLNAQGETVAEVDCTSITDPINGVGFFAKDGATWTLIDDEGKQKGKEDFYDISTNSTFCAEVNSDYFDFEGAADQVVDYIVSNKLTFGENPQKIFSDVSPDYSYTGKEVVIKSATVEGFKYGMVIYATFNDNIARWGGSGYEWNTESRLKMYAAAIATDRKNPLGKDEFDTLVKSLESKGFKQVKSSASDAPGHPCNCLLEKGNIGVIIMMKTGERTIVTGVFQKSDTELWDDALEVIANSEASNTTASDTTVQDAKAEPAAPTADNATAENAPSASAAPASSGNDFVAMVTQRKLTAQDLAPYSKAQLRLMRNTIYAIHGRKFTSKDLQQYFSQFAWYKPRVAEVSNSELSSIEQYNAAFIRKYE